MTVDAAQTALPARIRWALMFGNFVIGCGVMSVAGTLNDMARSLQVSVALAGQLIAIAAAMMAFGAPLLAGWVAGFDRRRLLALSRMKPTSLLVNTSRAELIEEGALVSALNRGRPGMAAVDVFESEPILQGHPLLRLENAVCTPHIGYVEQDSYELYFKAAFENVVNFIGGNPTNIVNPDALRVLR